MIKAGFEYEQSKIEYGGGKIQTYSFGTGDKVILAIPSYPITGILYLSLFRLYDLTKVKVVTFDIPGWAGESDNIFEGKEHRIEDYVDIAKTVIGQQNTDQFSVLGYSFGGALSIKLASDMKDQIDKLVLVSPVFSKSHLGNHPHLKLIKLAKALNASVLFKTYFFTAFWEVMEKELKGKIDQELYDEIQKVLESASAETMLQDANAIFEIEWSKYLENINPNKLMLVSSKEERQYFKNQVDFLREYFKYPTELFYPGAHENFLMIPEKQLAEDIVEFLIN